MRQAEAEPRAVATATGVLHHGITVGDIERSLRLYRDILGLTVVIDRTTSDAYLSLIHAVRFAAVRMTFLRIPETADTLELVEYHGIEGSDWPPVAWNSGVGHLCFAVSDVDRLCERIRAEGLEPLSSGPIRISSGPNEGAKVVKFRDFDGYWIELMEPARPVGRG